MKPYKKENITTAQMLRKNMTPYERKLWYEFLRNYPVRFQRQKCIGAYIADFYCAKARLVLELDGNGHYTDEQQEYDKTRTMAIEELGIQVIRITNLEISNRFSGVCSMIDKLVKEKLDLIK